MSRVAYVNGRYVQHAEAQVHIEDRGYQFSDGVYEVAAVCRGRVIDEEPHFDRLQRSLAELEIDLPLPQSALRLVTREVLRRNRVTDGMVYTQITRGVASRDHPFPDGTHGAVVLTARPFRWPDDPAADQGADVVSMPDERWGRCDIKSISLLPNVLGKQAARDRGAYEAWFVDPEGYVTEGASTNAWIIDVDGRVITRDIKSNILGGITRHTVIALAREAGIEVIERSFTLEEAHAASEAFLTSTTAFVRGIVRIDGAVVGDGTPGPITIRLRGLYLDYCRGASNR
jgi:D-alanine transaminase